MRWKYRILPAMKPLKPLVEQVLALAEVYCAATGRSEARVATIVRNHGGFFRKLREGGDCTTKNAEATIAWFSENWPAGCAWPESVPRPPASRPEAAA